MAEPGDSLADAPAAARSAEDSAAAVRAHSEAVVPSGYEAAAADDSFPDDSSPGDYSAKADSRVDLAGQPIADRCVLAARTAGCCRDDWSPDDCWEPVDSAEADSLGWADSAPADSAEAGWVVAGCSAG